MNYNARVLTDNFVRVKMCFWAHFSCKISTKYYPRTCRVLLLKNRRECRLVYNLVGLSSPGINSIQGEHTGKTAELYYLNI